MNSRALAIAFGATAGILWLFCSALVWLMPGEMMGMSGHMVHADLSHMQWHFPIIGFLIGGIAWVGIAALTGYMIGAIYNRLDQPSTLA